MGDRAQTGPRPSRRTVITGASILAAILVVIAAIVIVPRLSAPAAIPRVTHISANSTTDSVQFTWSDPGLRAGDVYLVRVDGGTGVQQTAAGYTLDKSSLTGQACVTVAVVRAGTSGAPSASTCAGG